MFNIYLYTEYNIFIACESPFIVRKYFSIRVSIQYSLNNLKALPRTYMYAFVQYSVVIWQSFFSTRVPSVFIR